MGLTEYNTAVPPREVPMHDQRRTQLIAYAVAVLGTGLSLTIRLLLVPWLGYHAEFMTFFPIIMVSAYLGGLGPGIVATVLSAAAGDYFLVKPRFSLPITNVGSVYVTGLFVFVASLISIMIESLNRFRLRINEGKQSRAQQAVREAEQRFRYVAENMREIFWVTDLRNSRVMYVSPGYDEVWGRSTQ